MRFVNRRLYKASFDKIANLKKIITSSELMITSVCSLHDYLESQNLKKCNLRKSHCLPIAKNVDFCLWDTNHATTCKYTQQDLLYEFHQKKPLKKGVFFVIASFFPFLANLWHTWHGRMGSDQKWGCVSLKYSLYFALKGILPDYNYTLFFF